MQISVPDNLSQNNNSDNFEPVPAGKYETTIFDIQAETVKSGQNEGKPRWKVQLKIAEGQFENRRLFVLIPLYIAGDFWKTQIFFESLGFKVKGNFDVPEINALLGKAIIARVVIREAQGDFPADNNVSGFEKASAKSGADLLASMGATSTDSSWAS